MIRIGHYGAIQMLYYYYYYYILYIFDIFDNFDIFQKMKISNKLYNNGCNTLMQYLMTITYQSFVRYVKT